jgi:lipoprotein-releasing system permease protein
LRVPYELYLALRYLRFHRGRTLVSVITLISVAGVMVGTAALVIALSLNAGFVRDVRERIHSGSAHLTVLTSDDAPLFRGGTDLARRIAAEPGVRGAAEVVYTPALVTSEELGLHAFAEVHGIDPAAHDALAAGTPLADEFSLLEPAPPGGRGGILLGEQLAAKIGALPGDAVRVLVPRVGLSPFGAYPHNRVFQVVGTFRSEHFEQDARRAYVRIDEARSLLRAADAASWVEVRLDELDALADVKARLRTRLAPDWLVVDLLEQNQEILKALNTEKLILMLAIGLIVLVAALNIVSTLVLMVADKVKEIGTLTALGARPPEIARVFVLQGLVIGLVGTTAGLAAGTALCRWLDRYEVIPLDPDVYYLDHVPFTTEPRDVMWIGAMAMLISLLATLYPALKAARLDPVEALRYE